MPVVVGESPTRPETLSWKSFDALCLKCGARWDPQDHPSGEYQRCPECEETFIVYLTPPDLKVTSTLRR